jgi:thiosulfate/3-mercaptopyruvate sulfurtransferase
MIAPIAALFALAVQGPRDPMLVTPAWLAEHARDANLVLLQIGPRASYDSAHIAGARFISMSDVAAPRDTTKPALELPTPAALDSALEALGISDDSRIVIYQSDEWFTPATRVYLTLYWAGLGARTSLLDGGMNAWHTRGGAVTSAAPTVRRGTLTLHPRSDVVVTADWVAAHLTDSRVAIVDARDERFYLGNYPARPQEQRPGHLPGAWNIPFTAIVTYSGRDSGLVRPAEWLRTTFEAAHAEPGDTVVAYCHIGQQATLVWFGAKLAGYEVRLYDGSFTQWSNLTQYPVERP